MGCTQDDIKVDPRETACKVVDLDSIHSVLGLIEGHNDNSIGMF